MNPAFTISHLENIPLHCSRLWGDVFEMMDKMTLITKEIGRCPVYLALEQARGVILKNKNKVFVFSAKKNFCINTNSSTCSFSESRECKKL